MSRSKRCPGKTTFFFVLLVFGISCLMVMMSIQATSSPIYSSQLTQYGAIGQYDIDRKSNGQHSDLRSPLQRGSSKHQIRKSFSRNSSDIVHKTVNPPAKHVFFRKVHKAASSVIQNIIFRYGYTRQKNFVLPSSGNYITSPTEIVPVPRDEEYDFLCTHVLSVSHSQLSKLLPGHVVHLGIVRNPFERLVSAFNYYHRSSYIKRIRGVDPLGTYLQDPLVYEPRDPAWSYTNNKMAQDFGYMIYEPHSFNRFNRFLQYVNSTLTLVLVSERLDESLVVLRRLLHWSMKDMLYISQNINDDKPDKGKGYNTSKANVTVLKFDNILYELFFEKFEYEIRAASEDFNEEVTYFKEKRREVVDFCLGDPFSWFVPESRWHDGFHITSSDCSLLRKKEMDFIDLIREYQWKKILTRQW